MKKIKNIAAKHKIKTAILLLLVLAYAFCLPKHLFQDPTSTVLLSRKGELMNAKIAADGQWRFPEIEQVPEKFEKCILLYEDEYFRKHPGFNPVSIIRAIKANVKAGSVVQGGSTITQQTIRLARKNKGRTYTEKGKELILATRLELRYSKKKILQLYSSHAPFGGNVVGLEAASWRYFGVAPDQLSWAESATLAVLPNAPSLVHPGKNREILLQKRNALLEKLKDKGVIDQETQYLASLELLPNKPHDLPQYANHLLERLHKQKPGEELNSTINLALQQQNMRFLNRHSEKWAGNGVHNGAVLVIHIPTREVVSYVGNASTTNQHKKDVDIITAPRSTGSLLKPLLYASMLDAGEILPESVLPDVPTIIGSYNPKNFNKTYSGAASAKEALYRSLNVPSVRMLQEHGVDRFKFKLNELGLNNINKSSNYYGLSLILGGAESSLWDMSRAYTSLASTLNHFDDDYGAYYKNELADPILLLDDKYKKGRKIKQHQTISAASIWHMTQALTEVKRPFDEQTFGYFKASKRIAWKTGTSFGHRDAWAIGWNSEYLVGVWMGNADGEGRPGLTGLQAAAPLLFNVFGELPTTSWFEMPYKELFEAETCVESGFLKGPNCLESKTTWVNELGTASKACPYHKTILLTADGKYSIGEGCQTESSTIASNYFVLPPAMEWYYKQRDPGYKTVPPLVAGCVNGQNAGMSLLYPQPNTKVIIPRDLDGKKEKMVMRLAHKRPKTEVYWYINNQFLGATKDIHEMEVQPEPGKHRITVTDANGAEVSCMVEVG